MGIEEKISPLLERLRANPRLLLLVGTPVAIAVIVAAWLWSRAPDYGVLYSNLSDRDGGAIIASLQQMNVPYRFTEGGSALLIPADKVPETRLRLASQGLPKGGAAGFELMDNQKFGTSQFAEQINYQRALEGQLALSIESISAVESARVHLALPKPSLFVRNQQPASASVILKLHRGRAIDDGQVNAIAHLVSSSVPELTAKNVTIVDQSGNLLSSPTAGSRGLDASQLKYTQEIEQSYIRRIEAILRPIVGAANVRAQVAADIDFSVVENTDEKYRPNQEPGTAAVRSQQSSESSQQGAVPPGGVPGALSNQPPVNPAAPIVTAPANAPKGATAPGANVQPGPNAGLVASSARSGSARKDVTTNYEVDRSIRHMQQGAGGIRRLSVAVVVNYRRVLNADGKPVARAPSATEQEQVSNLVKQAMGYNAERGDTVNVVHSPFASEATESEAPLPVWQRPENIELAKRIGIYALAAALVLLLLWLIVARLSRRKRQSPVPAEPDAHTEERKAHDAGQEEARQRATRHQENLRYAQETAENDPRLAATVIKNWMDFNE